MIGDDDDDDDDDDNLFRILSEVFRLQELIVGLFMAVGIAIVMFYDRTGGRMRGGHWALRYILYIAEKHNVLSVIINLMSQSFMTQNNDNIYRCTISGSTS
jgi:hypothetical protein